MQYGAILDIAVLTNTNGVDIAAENSIKPKCGPFTNTYVTHYGGVFHHDYRRVNDRGEYLTIAVYRFYKSHIFNFSNIL